MTNDAMDAEHARYSEWDAAYVLGALSAPDRADYERHLRNCRRCTAAVSELAGMPGLLGKVDQADVPALLNATVEEAVVAGPPADLMARITRSEGQARSRRLRRRVTILVAAAVVAAAAVIVPITLSGGEKPTVSTVLTTNTAVPLTAEVQMFGEQWGTRITVTCGYAKDGKWQNPQPAGPRNYGLYVVDSDGRATLVSSWAAHRGETVHATGSTNVDVAAINTVQIRSIETGKVLLAADVR